MKRPSQNQRILEVLSDRRWHTHHELYAIGCVAHSRLAELRSRGHEIEQRRQVVSGAQVWEYRLVAPLRDPSARPSFPLRPERLQPAAQPEAETARLASVAGTGDALAGLQLSFPDAA